MLNFILCEQPVNVAYNERSKKIKEHHLESVYDLNTEFTGNSSTFGCFQNACAQSKCLPLRISQPFDPLRVVPFCCQSHNPLLLGSYSQDSTIFHFRQK